MMFFFVLFWMGHVLSHHFFGGVTSASLLRSTLSHPGDGDLTPEKM